MYLDRVKKSGAGLRYIYGERPTEKMFWMMVMGMCDTLYIIDDSKLVRYK